jgi:hypothetical protein
MTNTIFIKTHLGMGDNIVHNGLIRKIAKENPTSQVFTAAKNHYLKNVQYMYRDVNNITVVGVNEDAGLQTYLVTNKFDKIISTHFGDGNVPYKYDRYFDDAFYMMVGENPKVKKEYYHLERNEELENKIYNELIVKKGITDYIFIHEKKAHQILIDRNRIEKDLPIIVAEEKYGVFELLKVIENAKSVHVISSCFLSLFMCKQYNKNFFAHMYCDRAEIAPYIKKHGINVIL